MLRKRITSDKSVFILLLLVYALVCLLASWLKVTAPMQEFWGRESTNYNNFLIFKHAFVNLSAGRNLYVFYPEVYADLYKYSPTFAFLMCPFQWLPDPVGAVIWNLLNTVLLVYALHRIRHVPSHYKFIALMLLLPEAITSAQNFQSNGLMVVLMLLSYRHYQDGKPMYASLWLVISVYIKIYSAVLIPLYILSRGGRRYIPWFAMWGAVFLLLPLLVTSPQLLLRQYTWWYELLVSDHNASLGLSVQGLLDKVHVHPPMMLVQIIGLVLLYMPLLRIRTFSTTSSIRYFSGALIWMIIFNHKAESPAYVIAMSGVLIWFVSGDIRNRVHLMLLITAMLFTSLSTSDLFPKVMITFMREYYIKALPCVIIWCILQWELFREVFTQPAHGIGNRGGS